MAKRLVLARLSPSRLRRMLPLDWLWRLSAGLTLHDSTDFRHSSTHLAMFPAAQFPCLVFTHIILAIPLPRRPFHCTP
ncbi:hypothetical protein BS47DRAFT_618220 [Hydnum rufescens UP504]|uniref:Uncharacterized protein n=1 Tax=Hydnum rufescens UP504 TaxID=1448309 RepID=A0A9P6DWP4_9AGAM|nr:hypothetical protein BS47DRAFT_618220 [Hydnum rufescens UP504]